MYGTIVDRIKLKLLTFIIIIYYIIIDLDNFKLHNDIINQPNTSQPRFEIIRVSESNHSQRQLENNKSQDI